VLSDEGNARAYAVGARIRRGVWTSALEALWQANGRGALEVRSVGARIRRTRLGEYDGLVWSYLAARGLVEFFKDAENNDGVQLTEKGEQAHRAGEDERARLLERCRRAAGVDHVR
jgi:hypothetical protein